MREFRPVVFSIRPAGQNLLRTVTLYEDTWQQHIVVNHPDVAGRLADVELTASMPTVMLSSNSAA
jgi:hypothetical protein